MLTKAEHRPRNVPFYGLAPRQWPGQTIVILGSGPSLIEPDLEYVRTAHAGGRCKVIAINDTHRKAPWADVLYACDAAWWDKARGAVDFPGQRWTQNNAGDRHASRWGLFYVRGRYKPGLSLDPSLIHYGGNSGYQCVNIAAHFSGGRQILMGFDMQLGADGRRHHHDMAPHRGTFPAFGRWVENFKAAAADLRAMDIDVVNCSRATAIPETIFRRAALDSVL